MIQGLQRGFDEQVTDDPVLQSHRHQQIEIVAVVAPGGILGLRQLLEPVPVVGFNFLEDPVIAVEACEGLAIGQVQHRRADSRLQGQRFQQLRSGPGVLETEGSGRVGGDDARHRSHPFGQRIAIAEEFVADVE